MSLYWTHLLTVSSCCPRYNEEMCLLFFFKNKNNINNNIQNYLFGSFFNEGKKKIKK